MKKSVSRRLFFIISSIITGVIIIYLLLNSLVLSKYYISTKQTLLKGAYDYINTSYNKNVSSAELQLQLDKFDADKNINIVIYNANEKEVYSSAKNFVKVTNSEGNITSSLDQKCRDIPNYSFKKNLEINDKYQISLHSDKRLHSDFIILNGELDNGYQLVIRASVQSIEESVKVYNKFLFTIGIITIIISGIVSYIMSKRFTKPVLELSEIASSMSNLDFSQKYNVKSEDEIGVLGKSINTLSSKLETTINKLKKSNTDLERDIEKKSKIDEMRKQFISDVSHELKTPIALIQGYAEGLAENVVSDEESKKYYCEIILDETEKMNKLVQQLLILSKLEYGNEKINKQDFSITKLISDIINKFNVIFEEKQIKVETNIEDSIYVSGDEFMIEQVVTNYMNNAINHIAGERKIQIKLAKNGEQARVSVFNTGKQIPEEEQFKIWNRFYKADKSRNREAGGTGIGLSLVKTVITKHGNKYGVENKEDGVEFWFELDIVK